MLQSGQSTLTTMANEGNISHYITDAQVLQLLKQKGIINLNLIQIQAITDGLFYHNNMLVCTPSGSGKTLIGEMAIANTLLRGIGKAIYLVPYKALANEKGRIMAEEYEQFGYQVQTITSDAEEIPQTLPNADLIIATYEKCDSLMRQNMEFMNVVKCIVIDEIHEISTPMRGGRLEILLIRLLSQLAFTQIIALSATINNYMAFREWLGSFGHEFVLIHTASRPIPLKYNLIVNPNRLKAVKDETEKRLQENAQVLIFVNKRADCLRFAQHLAPIVKKILTEPEIQQCLEAKKELRNAKSIAFGLIDLLESGVAYHNASLGPKERKLIERLFHNKVIKVIIATTTLAAGINLPAREVIVTNIIQNYQYGEIAMGEYEKAEKMIAPDGHGLIQPISPNMMFQMLGRAGRPGLDPLGIGTIILKDKTELELVRTTYFQREVDSEGYLMPKYADLTSQLNYKRTLEEFILLLVSAGGGITQARIKHAVDQTFFAYCLAHGGFDTDRLLEYLLIDRMDLNYFLELHGTKIGEEIPTRVKLLQLKSDLILCQVNIKDAMFFPQISLAEGFYCSCPGKKPKLDSSMAHSKFMIKLCPHLTLMLHELIKDPTSNTAKMSAYMVPLIAGQEYILDYLQANALITMEVGEYKLTALGRLALNLYLYPDEVIWLKSLIENHVFLDQEFILDKALQYYAMQKSYSIAVLKNIMTLWMEEHTVEDILANYPQHGLGDIFMFRMDIARVLSLFQAIANYLGKEDLVVEFKRLESRITYGVKEELCDLMDYYSPYLNRNRARILFNAGFTTITKIAQTDPVEIYKTTKIPLEKIIEMVTLRGQPKPKNLELDNL